MSALAEARPGDRMASVLSDDEETGTKSSPSAKETVAAGNSWGEGDSPSLNHDEGDNDMPKPSYTFDRTLKIRDFAYPPSDPRHYGKPYDPSHSASSLSVPASQETLATRASDEENYSARFSGPATALYDFEAENPSELSFREGQVMTILFRQCAGWLVAQIDVEDTEDTKGDTEGGGEEGVQAEEQSPGNGEDFAEDDGPRQRKVRTIKGLVPENYVQIWHS